MVLGQVCPWLTAGLSSSCKIPGNFRISQGMLFLPGPGSRYFHPAHGELVYTTLIEWLFVSGPCYQDETTSCPVIFRKAARSACGGGAGLTSQAHLEKM
jgi:hypothetical protein